MNKTFFIKNIGTLAYVASLVDIDYPRTFVCKRVDIRSTDLFLFDEYNHGDNFVEWLCVQISYNDLDRLNYGYITLESCFFGPRGTPKSGYIVVSRSDMDVAESRYLANISSLITDNQTYIDSFVDDNHGAGLLSLVYGKPIISLVVKPEKFADPMISTTRITSGSSECIALMNALPYAIETRNNRMCVMASHSLVMYFEVSDKKGKMFKQNVLSEDFEDNVESKCAFGAIETMLNKESTNEQVINAFKGDKKSIEKASNFIAEIKRNNKKNTLLLQAVDYSKNSSSKPFSFSGEIDNETVKYVKKKCNEVIEIIDNKDNHIIDTFVKQGQFLMLDTTGRRKFKFQSTEKGDNGAVISGFADTKVNGLMVDDNGNKQYTVKIQSDVLKGKFGLSKPIYTLLEIIDVTKKPDQLELFKQ